MTKRADAQSPAPHVADRHDLIRVHGARVKDRKDVSVVKSKAIAERAAWQGEVFVHRAALVPRHQPRSCSTKGTSRRAA